MILRMKKNHIIKKLRWNSSIKNFHISKVIINKIKKKPKDERKYLQNVSNNIFSEYIKDYSKSIVRPPNFKMTKVYFKNEDV